MAKQILPWFGGAPSVWSACLVFFQVALIGGYLYAHVTRRLSVAWQAGLHVSLLLAALSALPILVSPEWKPLDSSSPSWRVVMLLAATIGIPYTLLGATAPLLQDWWRLTSGREPYRLYALSNIGSLAALGLYPTAVERFLSVPDQAFWWSAAYVVFVVICACAAWTVTRSAHPIVAATPPITRDTEPPVTTADLMQWTALSACGSGLLMSVTNQLCQDVAVVPMLWVMPLAVYLLTFILTFGGVYPRRTSRILFLAGVASALWVTARAASMPLPIQVVAFLSLLAGACMVCHGELVAARPGTRHLTGFYLAIAVGGALGGLSVAFIAPLLFTSYLELPILVLLVVMLVALPAGFRSPRSGDRVGLMLLWATPAIVFAVVVGWAEATGAWGSPNVTAVRDFYGILRVADHGIGTSAPWREVSHGRVSHGVQLLGDGLRRQPTSYYAKGSGVAFAFEQHANRLEDRSLKAGIVGLGAGTIAAWGREGDQLFFFELNPSVVELAGRDFTFLRDSAATISVITADARLALEREMADPANRGAYDVLVIDAFSGDSIPAHLLTRECFALYVQALAPSGVIAFHISNLFLDLRPLVHGLAEGSGFATVEVRTADHPGQADRRSDWVLASADRDFLTRAIAAGAVSPSVGKRLVWTDSYSSILSVLR